MYMATTNRPFSIQRMRGKLARAQGFLCHWCKKEMHFADGSKRYQPKAVTVDHVIPRWRGGSDHWDNLVGACRKCNDRRNKEDQPPPEYSTDAGRYQSWLEVRSMSSASY